MLVIEDEKLRGDVQETVIRLITYAKKLEVRADCGE